MRALIKDVKKRDGTLVSFDREKITSAIFKAAQSVGGKDRGEAEKLADDVVKLLEKQSNEKPTVEEIQDTVERVLIENGHAKTAKAYILYRQRRAEIRAEKRKTLEKESLDEVDKAFDVNALRVLKSRYLRKSEEGKLIETPKELFTRVAVHTGLANLFYDEKVFDKNAKQPVRESEELDEGGYEGKLRIGKYTLNVHHINAVKRLYARLNVTKQMKVSLREFIAMLGNGSFDAYEKGIDDFYNLMVSKRFMPNTPAIANFGTHLGMGSACFVLGIDDSMESIMETLKNTAIIHKSGGGTGFNFSDIRPEGDFVSTTSGVASGPVSFMRLFDTMTEVVKQGGIRRGANMGILNVNHPDVEKFIKAKEGNKALRNFNISVLMMPDFWYYYETGKPYPLVNPRNDKVMKYTDPKVLLDTIVYQAWESAEPGIIFYDTVNKYNPFFKHLGPIVTTNPCGEVLLYPNEPCNLGSINVWAFTKENESGEMYMDWDALKETIMQSTKFLDCVIDVNNYPLKAIEEMSLSTRKIGLGLMGLADLMYELRIPYNTKEGVAFMEQIMEFINYWSKVESVRLAEERGPIPYYSKSFYPEGRLPIKGFDDSDSWHFDWTRVAEDAKTKGIRNGFTTVVAPTGSISMISGCSSGMEPVYSLAYEKHVAVGSFYYVEPVFEKIMQKEGLYDEELIKDVCTNNGSVQGIGYIPRELKKVFITAMDIKPEDHIRALAAIQKWTDSSVSKTNNFPANATVEDMKKSYLLAYELGCKDVTVFRDTSIKEQVLRVADKKRQAPEQIVEVSRSAAGMLSISQPERAEELRFCPQCKMKLIKKEGCLECMDCGWGMCSSD